jgi:hypothetical protein
MLCNVHPAAIPFDVDDAGFVLVSGARVPHTAAGAPLRWRPSCVTTCQHCKRHNVDRPLTVVALLEAAVPGGVQYFTKIADGGRRHCDECLAEGR